MALNLELLEKDLEAQMGDIFRLKDNEDVEFRILPLNSDISPNGLFFTVTSWWLGAYPDSKGSYISAKTFGEDCEIEKLIDEAKSLRDRAVDSQIAKMQSSESYLFAGLIIDSVTDDKGRVVDSSVRGDRCVWFQATRSVKNKITKLVMDKQFASIGPDSLTDVSEGHNLVISRLKEKGKVSYDVVPMIRPTQVDPTYLNKIPDIVNIYRKYYDSDLDTMETTVRKFLLI